MRMNALEYCPFMGSPVYACVCAVCYMNIGVPHRYTITPITFPEKSDLSLLPLRSLPSGEARPATRKWDRCLNLFNYPPVGQNVASIIRINCTISILYMCVRAVACAYVLAVEHGCTTRTRPSEVVSHESRTRAWSHTRTRAVVTSN